MSNRFLICGFLAFLAVTVVSGQSPQPSASPRLGSGQAAPRAAAVDKQNAQRAVLDKYCVGCHNARVKAGGLLLDQLDLSRLADQAAIGEKVALKLRAG